MGVYPLTFASLFLGEPSTVSAAATLSEAGVDLSFALSLGYDSGAIASLTSTMTAWSPRTASIATDRGRLDFPSPFHNPPKVTWQSYDADPDFAGANAVDDISEPVIGTGLANEALEVVRCLRNGETESPLVPLDDTVAMMRLLDRIRGDIGVHYAADHQERPAG
jgi:predicted dehydrogenase